MSLLPVLFSSCFWLLLAASSDSEDRIRELRIEVVKLQILSRLQLRELPPLPTHASDDALSREAVRLLLREEENDQSHAPHHKQRLVVPATGDGEACPDTNSSACHTFLYEFGSSLNGSIVDLWVWKSEQAPPGVSLYISFILGDELQGSSYFDVGDTGWNKLRLLEELSLPDNDTAQAEVQIIGRWVEHRGPHRPYLMSTIPWSPVRRRRDVAEGTCNTNDTCDTNESCCLRPLHLSFSEIGFHFIVYPEALEANMCVGRCRLDYGTLRTHYERALYTTLEKNSTLADTLGECWTPCCKPKRLKEVRVIYKDMENLHHDQFIPELSVESCSCS